MAAVLRSSYSAANSELSGQTHLRWRGLLPAALFACCACSPGAFDGLGTDEASAEAGVNDGQASGSEPGPDLDAGEESDASAEGDAGAEPEDAEADAEADSAVEAGAMCQDTARDPRNCGTCGYDCSASFASVSCINSRCSRTCDEQHEDCNRDLASGSDGDGCETRIDNDTKNCGGCDMRCVASPYGFANCRAGQCYDYSLKVREVRAGPLHGDATGGAAFNSQLCPPDEVLVGLSGVSGQGVAYGLRVHCARLAISRTSSGYAVKLMASAPSTMIGGLIGPEPPPPYDLPCPAGAIVTGVAGATWVWPGQSALSIRQISLSCATPSLSSERQLILTPTGAPVTIGDTNGAGVAPFSHACGARSAVAGFTGRSGAYLDAIATHCGQLVIEEGPGQLSAPR